MIVLIYFLKLYSLTAEAGGYCERADYNIYTFFHYLFLPQN